MLFKKTLKIIARTILGVIAFIILYFLAAFLLSVVGVKKEGGQSNNVAIYILINGDHTDIVVPVKNRLKDWSKEISYKNTIAHDTTAHFLSIGWGDKGFYLSTPTWTQLKFSTAFKAAFGLSTAAIHTTFYKKMYEDTDCKKIMISNGQYLKLVNYIDDSFKRDSVNSVINIKTNANYCNDDAFYEAKGKYSLFYTCNTWANNALKACGQKAATWTPFDKGIFYQYK